MLGGCTLQSLAGLLSGCLTGWRASTRKFLFWGPTLQDSEALLQFCHVDLTLVPPVYISWYPSPPRTHTMQENEAFMQVYEPLLFNASVDLTLAGCWLEPPAPLLLLLPPSAAVAAVLLTIEGCTHACGPRLPASID